jgi:hypothetical protein
MATAHDGLPDISTTTSRAKPNTPSIKGRTTKNSDHRAAFQHYRPTMVEPPHQTSNNQGQNNQSGHHCFLQGSRILTIDGDVPVENLQPGDWVVTTNAPARVKWIGRQVIRKTHSAAWGRNTTPVRVSAFAIDDQSPQRDLYLSPEHALLIDGALIPVKYLVNGHSVSFDEEAAKSDTLEYFSVHLDTHEVIYAEGALAETFLYRRGRIAWDNLAEYEELYGTEHAPMAPFASVHRYKGGRQELSGLLRLTASRFVDVRDPIQIAHDQIAERLTPVKRRKLNFRSQTTAPTVAAGHESGAR